ncbi:fad NAD binding oxidoreductase [Reticulomyxa filosa]|uniref:Fad NAD binding oxidoreductase n=1 Tax=Reticulomyxa filosa TaxID=46433 RepID=X6PAI3_RETFI|nr:fad NAD binding oxidoreductase [Reticulomyxa filosa]|eukprot:ETO34657.1 fad NAD binding oxidoreductase [Reticulomyxa filosa]
MDDDEFQFVDVSGNDSTPDVKTVREELQKLRETLSTEDEQVKSLEKEMKEWRVATSKMSEELSKLRQEKEAMQKEMEAMEQKNKNAASEMNALKQEVEQLKKVQIVVSSTVSSPNGSTMVSNTEKDKHFQIESSSSNTNNNSNGNGNSNSNTIASSSNHSKTSLKELDKSQCYSCKACGTHIALEGDIINRSYQIGQGPFSETKRGYLFKTAVNLTLGTTKTETFTSGSYEISWTSCSKCGISLGWKYLTSSNEANASKVGKFCLARYSLASPQERTQP